MKKYLLTSLLCLIINLSYSQIVTLTTNGYNLSFKKIDTLFFEEFEYRDLSSGKLFTTNDPLISKLPYSLGVIRKNKEKASSKFRDAIKADKAVFTSNFYVFEDGTLEAPTSSLFFKPLSVKFLSEIEQRYGITEKHPILDGYYFLHLKKKLITDGDKVFEICRELQKENLVIVIEPVFIKLLKVNNPLLPLQWNLNNIGNIGGSVPGADMRINFTRCLSTGAGIKVAVIDDGVDLSHPDLQTNLLPGYDATGNGSSGGSTTNNSHGTSCAGIISSVNNTIGTIGVAFNSQIIPCRLGIENGGVFTTNNTWISNCFYEAVARGADVISNSWGGGSQSAQIDAAIQHAVTNGRNGKGSVVFFSSGNRNMAIAYPSTNSNVIAVGASTPCDTRKRSSDNPAIVNPGVATDPEGTSCDGEFFWGSNFGDGLDLIAPGVLIPTTDNVGPNGARPGDYNETFNGTSAACPNAAGVMALILSANPNLTGSQARFILESTCDKVGGYLYQANAAGQPNGTWTNQAGYGRINSDVAVRQALGQNLSITGPLTICNSADYFIPNLPAGTTVTWSIPSAAGPVLQLAQNIPVQNQLRITNMKWYQISTTLTATISSGCSNPILITKTIANDNDNSATQYGSFSQPSCTVTGIVTQNLSGSLSGSVVNLYPGCMATISLSNMFGKTVTVSNAAQPAYWSYVPPSTAYASGTLYVQIALGTGGTPTIFNVNGVSACYQKQLVLWPRSLTSRFSASINPNPVSNLLTVSMQTGNEEKDLGSTQIAENNSQLIYNIYELNTNMLKITQKSSMRGKANQQINVSSLSPGYHVLQIIDGDYIQTIKFLKL